MSRSLVPTLKQHRNGSAYCKYRGKFFYFGPWRSPDLTGYQLFLREVVGVAPDGSPTFLQRRPGQHTVADLLAAFIAEKERKYAGSEYADNLKKYRFRWKQAFQPLLAMYGGTLACDFGPKAFRAVRAAMIKDGRSRTYVNDLAAEIRLAFQWAVTEEIIPPSVFHAIKEVKIVRPGEYGNLPEGRTVTPVSADQVAATLPYLAEPVAAVIKLLSLTVSRPGEIANITAESIDKKGPGGAWVYWPVRHKTAWKGKPRFLLLNQEAQAILRKWWNPHGYLFVNERTGKPYTSEQLRKAIDFACKRAGIPYWFPYQIRHATYSSTSLKHGVEAAALLAGHASTKMSERYDHAKMAKAVQFIG